MTHSLHRCGRSQDKDFVWLLYHARGINDENLLARLRQAVGIAEDVGSVNWGDVKSGPVVCLRPEEIKARLTEKSRLRGAFCTRGQVARFLRKMKQADLGLCVTISGPLEEVLDSCRQAEITPHTINYSLGVFGRTDLLPNEDVLALTTMCGHHMVPDAVAAGMREKVRKGKATPQEAALEMATLCPCGIFNQQRAAELLKECADSA